MQSTYGNRVKLNDHCGKVTIETEEAILQASVKQTISLAHQEISGSICKRLIRYVNSSIMKQSHEVTFHHPTTSAKPDHFEAQLHESLHNVGECKRASY